MADYLWKVRNQFWIISSGMSLSFLPSGGNLYLFPASVAHPPLWMESKQLIFLLLLAINCPCQIFGGPIVSFRHNVLGKKSLLIVTSCAIFPWMINPSWQLGAFWMKNVAGQPWSTARTPAAASAGGEQPGRRVKRGKPFTLPPGREGACMCTHPASCLPSNKDSPWWAAEPRRWLSF